MANNERFFGTGRGGVPCDRCGGEILPDELAHVIDGFVICPDCFFDFVFDYFEDRLMSGSEIKELWTDDVEDDGEGIPRGRGAAESADGGAGAKD